MFEKFMSSNARDFAQRYTGTYGVFTSKGKRTLVKLTEIDVAKGVVSFIDRDDNQFFLNQNAEDDTGFEFISPKSSWHNTYNGAMLVRRVAQRQYLRGICDRNTLITDVNGSQKHVNFTNLSAIYDSNVTPLVVMKQGRSFAVSPQFAVNVDRKSVLLFNQNIGAVNIETGKPVEISLLDKAMFSTEITDAFRRAGIEAVIK